jgi:transglutaminase-like putative cysteine protease
VKFAREKRLMLGVLAFVAPLPLPLNEPRPTGVIGWGALALFSVAILWYLDRVRRGEHRPLGSRALNLLGAAYVPFLVVDLVRLPGGLLVRPMMHLALFALAAKLCSLQRERDKWHAVLGIFFVFVTAMATSSSVGIGLYLAAMLVLWAALLLRFTQFHVAALLDETRAFELLRETRSARVWVLAVLLSSVLLLSMPIFFLLPRLASPYLFAGGGSAGVRYMTGFSDEVTLDVIGRVRANQEVALRVEFDHPPLGEVRLRGAVYDRYATRRWERSGGQRRLSREPGGRFVLVDEPASARARVWLEPMATQALFAPTGARWLQFDRPIHELRVDDGNGVLLPLALSQPLVYDVGFVDSTVSLGRAPVLDEDPGATATETTLDRSGLTPEIAALAAEVAGDGDALARAQRIEQHLATAYGYTLDFVGRRSEGDPISEFLFRYRSGHCEYFASAMVLMLRSLDVPARFVTGFLGSEPSALGYHIVRQSNAHAWVEAWIPGRGWQVFDPTPPAGRPATEPQSLWSLMRQGYDFVVFRWDRYVISYGVNDQARLFEGVSQRLRAWWQGLWGNRDAEREQPRPTMPRLPGTAETETAVERVSSSGRVWLAGSVLLIVAVVSWLVIRQRVRPTGARAYLRLRGELRERGVPVEEAVAPIELRERVRRRFPAAGAAAERLVDLYLRESYGGATLTAQERRELEALLTETRRAMRKAS